MFVHMYIYLTLCLYMNVCKCVLLCTRNLVICLCMHVCEFRCGSICVHPFTDGIVYLFVYVCIVCIYVCMHMYVSIYNMRMMYVEQWMYRDIAHLAYM